MVERAQRLTMTSFTPAKPEVYRVNKAQRFLLTVGVVCVVCTWMAPTLFLALLCLDIAALVAGMAGVITGLRVRDQLPFAPLVTLPLIPTMVGGTHMKVGIATQLPIHWFWIALVWFGMLLVFIPVIYVFVSLSRPHDNAIRSNLFIHQFVDLLIFGLSTIGGLVILMYLPLLEAGRPMSDALCLTVSNIGLVILGASVVIGRTKIPSIQLGLALAVSLTVLGDIVLAQTASHPDQSSWDVLDYQAVVLIPLLLTLTMGNPYEGFRPHFSLEPTNTLRAGMVGTWVGLFICLPFIVGLNLPVPMWSMLVSGVMCLLTVRMWTLIGERDNILEDRYAHQRDYAHQIQHDAQTGLLKRSEMEYLFQGLKVSPTNATVLVYAKVLGGDRLGEASSQTRREIAIPVIATCLKGTVGDLGEVFRFRRDEFVIMFKPPFGLDEAQTHVESIIACLKHLACPDANPLDTYVHMALVPIDTNRDFEDAIRWGEVAIRERRERETLLVRVGEEHIAQVDHVTVTDQRLREAMRNDAFYLVYQPIMDTTLHHCVGLEAYARWRNTDTSPAVFVKSLEQVGLADAFGRWVLEEATQFAAECSCPISVNVSISHVQNSSFVNDIRTALDKSQLPPELLTIEFSECDLSIDLTRLQSTLKHVHDLGVQIALDDVGLGGLTLAELSRLPIEFMKIDRSLISAGMAYADSRELIIAINEAAASLGIEIIAEGIETNEELNLAISAGCSRAQGWLWTKELSAVDAKHWWTFIGRGRGLAL